MFCFILVEFGISPRWLIAVSEMIVRVRRNHPVMNIVDNVVTQQKDEYCHKWGEWNKLPDQWIRSNRLIVSPASLELDRKLLDCLTAPNEGIGRDAACGGDASGIPTSPLLLGVTWYRLLGDMSRLNAPSLIFWFCDFFAKLRGGFNNNLWPNSPTSVRGAV